MTTVRADDRPDLFHRNDQYVDKVRLDAQGQIVERVQTKFFGDSGKEWLSKMMSKKNDKYFDGGVDKIECPKNYYDDVKRNISEQKSSLEMQLEHVQAKGKADVAEQIRGKLDKLNKLDSMVEKSTVTTDEARFARMHPKAYAAKIFAKEAVGISHHEGLKSGALAAGLTFAVSTVDNVKSLIDGEITADEMIMDVMEDTATAGVMGYGTSFISTAVSQAMRSSSSQLIQRVGGSCLPAAAVSFAVESYQDISDFAQGKTDGIKLAYDLGENAAKVAGGLKGGALAGAAAGAIAGPIGAVAGSIVGGMVGCAVASEIYQTAVSLGVEGANLIADKAIEFAGTALDAISQGAPAALEGAKGTINNFFGSVGIGLRL